MTIRYVYVATFVFLAGCSTLVPVEMSSDQLRVQLSSGDVVQVGDKLEVTTVDGRTRKIKVESLTESHVVGKKEEIPINEIVSVRKRELSTSRTVGLIAIIVAVLWSAVDSTEGIYAY